MKRIKKNLMIDMDTYEAFQELPRKISVSSLVNELLHVFFEDLDYYSSLHKGNPTKAYNYIKDKYSQPYEDTSMLKFFLEYHPHAEKIKHVFIDHSIQEDLAANEHKHLEDEEI